MKNAGNGRGAFVEWPIWNLYSFGVLGNESLGIKNTFDMNLNYVLLNDLVEVIVMELNDSILTMECACADSRISAIWTTMTTPCQGGDPNKYPNEKDMQHFFFLNGVRDGRY